MRVKCLAHEHNTMFPPRLEATTLDPESGAVTMGLLKYSFTVAGNGLLTVVIFPQKSLILVVWAWSTCWVCSSLCLLESLSVDSF